MASCRLWLLRAKEFPNDERSREARRAEFYLKPGTYTVGRSATQCDIAVIDDQSISRLHAELEVTSLSDEKPSVLVKDKSRYGTLVSPVNVGLEAQGRDKEAVAYDGYYIKFGFKSPFRLDEWHTHAGAWVQGCPVEADHVPACSFPHAASLGLLKTRLDAVAREQPFRGLRFECSKALGGAADHLDSLTRLLGASESGTLCQIVPDEDIIVAGQGAGEGERAGVVMLTTPSRLQEAIVRGDPGSYGTWAFYNKPADSIDAQALAEAATPNTGALSARHRRCVVVDSGEGSETASDLSLGRGEKRRLDAIYSPEGSQDAREAPPGSLPCEAASPSISYKRRRARPTDRAGTAGREPEAESHSLRSADGREASDSWARAAAEPALEEPGSAAITYSDLVLVPEDRILGSALNSDGLPNFKAFRRKKQVPDMPPKAMGSSEAYTEVAGLEAGFEAAAAAEAAARRAAEELFATEMRASKSLVGAKPSRAVRTR